MEREACSLTINQRNVVKTNHRPWVNFKELRSRLRFEAVLIDHKVEIQRKGISTSAPALFRRIRGTNGG